jgi:ribulose-phosphate 3-epimerase
MKIVVSYISSLYDYEKTVELISKSNADAIHADLMDGVYVLQKNFQESDLHNYYKYASIPIEFHLMVQNPDKYLNNLYEFNPSCIYIHPKTTKSPIDTLQDITAHNIDAAIVINPDEQIQEYECFYPFVKRVLLMSVVPGKGGQKFLDETPYRLNKLLEYKKKYNFDIYIDGGINNETIKKVVFADGCVSGSYVCNSLNYNYQINLLKSSCKEDM